MKNAAWRQKHIANGDEALEKAALALALAANASPVDRHVALANSFIALARAHYRAVEVETNATVTQ